MTFSALRPQGRLIALSTLFIATWQAGEVAVPAGDILESITVRAPAGAAV
jgi:hypothetical protein